ncbi:hypothetical protein ACFXTO_026064 [Malus domestica]
MRQWSFLYVYIRNTSSRTIIDPSSLQLNLVLNEKAPPGINFLPLFLAARQRKCLVPKNVGCRATTREMGMDWQGGEGRGRSEACEKGGWIDFSSSNQGLVSGLRGGSKVGMVVRERGMAETEVMELGVGIPQTKGCCQWVLISAISITGM